MTVKLIKKEQAPEDMEPKMKKPDMEIESPKLKEQDVLPDHTHSEYDEMLVLVQQLQSELAQLQQKLGQTTATEALTGVPSQADVDKSKKTETPIGPDATKEIPQTNQPASGKPIEGEQAGDEAENKVEKPAKEFPKVAVQKNKIKSAKEMGQVSPQQKKDPTEPQPGETTKTPEEMEGATKQKLGYDDKEDKPLEGSQYGEQMDAKSADDKVDAADEDEEKDEGGAPMMEKIIRREFAKLKKEIQLEEKAKSKNDLADFDTLIEKQLSGRKTVVGGFENRKERVDKQEGILTARQQSNNTVMEYLQKSGNTRALSHFVRRA